ncbi:MAG: AAA family ATPase [Gammaproteobacteria bacterium]|nr:AAA family ATPase [Gammaproteobacteria bacterium]NIO61786.1 AAA family ATPase [Gammaproteobacteria bacterium]NIQ19037.1 AAA family ATPase [Gammaproteobacteria bacterium]NIT05086.1 AAA family ATPase [Gammaproteobacteria bacterium]NIT40459.1 AAA family ATPase [Gammaproteobacteria bacterium]
MYYQYFGLEQPPFRITPDTSLFYPGGNRGAILEALIYAIVNGEGMIKVVGEVGSGKTMLCRMLTVELPDHIEVVYLANPSLSPDNILHAIAFELKLDVKADDDRLEVMNKLQNYLLERHARSQQVVVFVEEAQGMPVQTLEQIRLLTNLETNENKLLQIVLFGQPELDEMISSRDIRQLKERITYSFNLGPLNAEEIKDYINTRIRACGCRSGDLFTRPAIQQISRYSNGLLRRINILSDKSLLASYAANDRSVKPRHVKLAARDTEFITPWQRYRLPIFVLATLVIMAILVFLTPLGQTVTGLMKATPVSITVPKDTDLVIDPARTDIPLELGNEASSAPEEPQPEAGQAATSMLADELAIEPPELPAKEAPDEQEILESILKDYSARYLAFDEIMNEQDAELFIQQIKSRLPESVYLGQPELPCRRCPLIVYRPVKSDENL